LRLDKLQTTLEAKGWNYDRFVNGNVDSLNELVDVVSEQDLKKLKKVMVLIKTFEDIDFPQPTKIKPSENSK